ncbi:hypothetical protein DKQ99_09580 [Salmonella enterica]|nr:hypothetical protein [Salmonella enterica]EBN0116137.1 hypothetical protein [Salmonella enterica subsp. enterica serovar Heidelberg]EBR9069551.1 hypothetical protein [Salmonella enterica subsp. enterica serovar Weltevreden]EDC0921295.1 hypothetical protein [Salmonella enterica subsp. enterica serovar Montevideo]EDL7998741.1 hypothetical protein [Salmonella enterica subsp. enterica serovar Rubislaw]EDW1680401.1 hypothetical protein [Salmonella enterica subsp. enterica serovar Bredeney]EEH49
MFYGLEERVHFYFCLLVAVGLSRKQGRIRSNRQKNAFIMKWLKNAVRMRAFRHGADSEIAWLRGEILRHPPDRDPEPLLLLIYQTASEMCRT